MNILIGADFVPTESNEQYFISSDIEHLLGEELASFIHGADYRIFNLEVPLTDDSSPIAKCGPNLIAKSETIHLYHTLGVDLLTLANNHIMDQGEQGYRSTIALLKKYGIDFVGSGENLSNAKSSEIIDINGKRIGIYACAEHEFSIATESVAGANPFDPLESYDHVVALKNHCDYIVVLYHGGKEHYRYPTPELQRYCRKFIDKGADLIVCQHSHCIGCEEKYKDGIIVYGQGNFLFDYTSKEEWKTSLLIQLTENGIEYIPLVKKKETVRVANLEQAEKILKEFEKRSQEILIPGFIEDHYLRFSNELLDDYLWEFCGASKSIVLRILNKISGYRFYKWYVRRKFDKKRKVNILNFILCEAHREVLVNGLSKVK